MADHMHVKFQVTDPNGKTKTDEIECGITPSFESEYKSRRRLNWKETEDLVYAWALGWGLPENCKIICSWLAG